VQCCLVVQQGAPDGVLAAALGSESVCGLGLDLRLDLVEAEQLDFLKELNSADDCLVTQNVQGGSNVWDAELGMHSLQASQGALACSGSSLQVATTPATSCLLKSAGCAQGAGAVDEEVAAPAVAEGACQQADDELDRIILMEMQEEMWGGSA
jgi:hypothetical protein